MKISIDAKELKPFLYLEWPCGKKKPRALYERSRQMSVCEIRLLLAARGVNLQVAGADGRWVSRAIPDL
jgi:hypothetical protein